MGARKDIPGIKKRTGVLTMTGSGKRFIAPRPAKPGEAITVETDAGGISIRVTKSNDPVPLPPDPGPPKIPPTPDNPPPPGDPVPDAPDPPDPDPVAPDEPPSPDISFSLRVIEPLGNIF